MTTSDLTPSSPRFLAAVAKMEEVEKLHPHAPLDALLLAAIPVLLDEPTPGVHDELLARTATHRSDGVGGGVALIRELETALRTEQSARQAAEVSAQSQNREVNRVSVVAGRSQLEVLTLQQRIDAAIAITNTYPSDIGSRVVLSNEDRLRQQARYAVAVRIRAALTAPTESKEADHE